MSSVGVTRTNRFGRRKVDHQVALSTPYKLHALKQGRGLWSRFTLVIPPPAPLREPREFGVIQKRAFFLDDKWAGHMKAIRYPEEVVLLTDLALHKEYLLRGIGKEVLLAVNEILIQEGARRLLGFVVESDLAKTPYLFAFYTKVGFTVEHEGPNTIGYRRWFHQQDLSGVLGLTGKIVAWVSLHVKPNMAFEAGLGATEP